MSQNVHMHHSDDPEDVLIIGENAFCAADLVDHHFPYESESEYGTVRHQTDMVELAIRSGYVIS